MRYSYKGVTKDQKTIQGIVDAQNREEAALSLRTRDILPIRIDAKEEEKWEKYLPFFKKRVGFSEVVFFTRQLSSMIGSGLTLMDSLRILKEQVTGEAMIAMINGIINDVENGKPFSASIAQYKDVFSPIYVSLIKAAEVSGLLDKVLKRLADNLEKQQKLRTTVKAALMYPAIVVIGMIVVMAIMMIFVIPQLSVLYNSLNVTLPLPTLIVVSISTFAINFWPIVLGTIALVIFAYKRWRATEGGLYIIDNFLLRIPIFGEITRDSILTEFSRTFGLLVGSGTLVVDALNQVSNTTGNVHYKNAILNVSRRVEKGVSVGDAMSAYPLFPPILVQMAKIGEETGKLDESLLKVSEYFERELDQRVKTLTTAMEPFILVVLGIGVAFLIISIITPIYSIMSSIK
ncbi:type II secretion system F family protein [Patescibacteria group bacterium]|nr:type II secretion system F family protein [Patescibacteria group bacterium]MCL5010319.1 type II secretion system F family protein [Patescibacteria group bacterium]